MNRERFIIELRRLFIKKGISTEAVVVFDPSMNTQNLGDKIIMRYCEEIIENIFVNIKKIHIAFHERAGALETKNIILYKYKFICGTNVLSPNVEHFCAFKTSERLDQYHDICLLGTGWGRYSDQTSKKSKDFYQCILSKRWIHSVRDRYTEKKLKEIGFENVLFTACPTMWKLTPELCSCIPANKAEEVVFTLTDYDQNAKLDRKMIEILQRNYKKIYFWVQGKRDIQYLEKIGTKNNFNLIKTLEEYTELLEKGCIDYVGTRLHAGIHALNYKIRTIIVAIDNRAEEIGKDTNLPIIRRKDIEGLEKMINSSWKPEIVLPTENIAKWKKQFSIES